MRESRKGLANCYSMYSSLSSNTSFTFDDTFGFDINDIVEGTASATSPGHRESCSSYTEHDHEMSGEPSCNLEEKEIPSSNGGCKTSLPINPSAAGCIGEHVWSKGSGVAAIGQQGSPLFGSYRDCSSAFQLEEALPSGKYDTFQQPSNPSFIGNNLSFGHGAECHEATNQFQPPFHDPNSLFLNSRRKEWVQEQKIPYANKSSGCYMVSDVRYSQSTSIPRSHSFTSDPHMSKIIHSYSNHENSPNSPLFFGSRTLSRSPFDAPSSPTSAHSISKGARAPAFSSMATGVFGPFSVPTQQSQAQITPTNSGFLGSIPDGYGSGMYLPTDNDRPLTAPPGLTEKSKCIYVGNLDPRVTEVHLRDMFSEAGTVEEAKIINDRNMYRAGFKYGFIEYRTSEAAEAALMTLNGRVVYGSEIKVNWAYASISNDKESNLYHIFVGDLSQEVNDYVLAKPFSSFPSYCEARIMWDLMTGRSRGFGFVSFKDRQDAEEAIRTMTGKVVGGREIRCNWACYKNKEGELGFDSVSSQTYPTNTTVYLGNLPNSISESQVYQLLQRANCDVSNVSSIKIQPEKGFCFIRLNSHENAVQMIIDLSGQMYKERELRCFWGRDKQNNSETFTSRSASPFAAVPKFPVNPFPTGIRK